MELKNAVAVCLISLFSATLVVLIAQSLDSRAAARLEPQLAKIAAELEALRAAGGLATLPGTSTDGGSLSDGLVVYYFHSNTRCPTCEAIEAQAHETVQTDFASPLRSGEMAWEVLNYEEPAASGLAAKFDILTPVVVLARMKDGQIEDWNRLDKVWGVVGDKPAFAQYLRTEISKMLGAAQQEPGNDEPGDSTAIPTPDAETGDPPVPAAPGDLPIPE